MTGGVIIVILREMHVLVLGDDDDGLMLRVDNRVRVFSAVISNSAWQRGGPKPNGTFEATGTFSCVFLANRQSGTLQSLGRTVASARPEREGGLKVGRKVDRPSQIAWDPLNSSHMYRECVLESDHNKRR